MEVLIPLKGAGLALSVVYDIDHKIMLVLYLGPSALIYGEETKKAIVCWTLFFRSRGVLHQFSGTETNKIWPYVYTLFSNKITPIQSKEAY